MITRFDSTSNPDRIERLIYPHDPLAVCNEPFHLGRHCLLHHSICPFFLDSIWQSSALASYGWRSKRPGEIAMPSACLACARIPISPYPRSSGATLPSTCFSPCCRIPSSPALERSPFRHSSSRSSVRLFRKLIFLGMPSAWRHGSHLC